MNTTIPMRWKACNKQPMDYIYKHTPHGEEESTCASSEVISGFSSCSVTDAELSWSSGISTLSDSAIVEDLVSESWENFAYSEVSERNHILYQRGFTTMMLNMRKLDCIYVHPE